MRRHTLATTLIRGGTGLVTVADMPGHAASTPSAPTPHPAAAAGLTKALTLLPQDR